MTSTRVLAELGERIAEDGPVAHHRLPPGPSAVPHRLRGRAGRVMTGAALRRVPPRPHYSHSRFPSTATSRPRLSCTGLP
ncbi:protein of unknown function [Blastococcus saxobsidens DD2]|uniref:Uncharacterized protein n=1 Tax=Blastococcus saxobsidens (strain DD2) TaxID=1146883 RepID=H6RJK8_BLASD|nr:protein of unknown function [Blastococcus saxobsidens DD2]